MTTITATVLRNNLFETLEKVKKGETISIILNGKQVGLLTPPRKSDWRKSIKTKATLKAKGLEAFAPLDDWENLT